MAILVAGGAGYIGSHTCVELLKEGYEVVVVDNLYNSSEEALKRVEQITGKTVKFYEADILDREALNKIFDAEDIDSVINFAGLKAVGESVQKPLEYYHNNITGTLILCDVMRNHGVKNIIFSSSATVYGDPAFIPITEECPKAGRDVGIERSSDSVPVPPASVTCSLAEFLMRKPAIPKGP